MLLMDSFWVDLFTVALALFVGGYFYVEYKYQYWIRRGVPQLPPVFPFGNYPGLPKGIHLGGHTKRYYDALKNLGHKLGGVYMGLDPFIVLVDQSYAKDVLTKDFQHFTDRGIFSNKDDPATVNLITQEGEDWKTSRAKFTSLFTTSKIKFFFNTMRKCSDELNTNLKKLANGKEDIDILHMNACYTTDVIASVVYGLEANSFKEVNNIIWKMGRVMFHRTLFTRLNLFFSICYPKLLKKINLNKFSSLSSEEKGLMYNIFKDSYDSRIKNKIYRQDFLQLLIESENSGVDLTFNEMVAQAGLFFAAGFETSSSTLTYTLYELGLNPNIQDRLRKEIYKIEEEHNGIITYEALIEMKYLDQIINETMRKYPLVATLVRVCVKNYKFQETDITIEKGTGVIIPVLSYHHDPEVFPGPSKWDPDRFEDKNVKYNGFLPFGDGPRNCIGLRYALMQVKLGLAQVLKDFQVLPSPNMKVPLEFEELTVVSQTKQTVLVRLKKLKQFE